MNKVNRMLFGVFLFSKGGSYHYCFILAIMICEPCIFKMLKGEFILQNDLVFRQTTLPYTCLLLIMCQ